MAYEGNPDNYGWRGDRCDESAMTTIYVGNEKQRWTVNKRAAKNIKQFVDRFDLRVESIGESGWDGGYGCRQVRGYSFPSKHSWGIAIDINASQHAQGRRNTFTVEQRSRIRSMLRAFPEFFWGGDFENTPDEMHFEIIKTPSECARLAYARTNVWPLPTGHWFGVQSPDPRNHSGYWEADRKHINKIRAKFRMRATGVYGTGVQAEVKAWQNRVKREPTGRVTRADWNLMF